MYVVQYQNKNTKEQVELLQTHLGGRVDSPVGHEVVGGSRGDVDHHTGIALHHLGKHGSGQLQRRKCEWTPRKQPNKRRHMDVVQSSQQGNSHADHVQQTAHTVCSASNYKINENEKLEQSKHNSGLRE